MFPVAHPGGIPTGSIRELTRVDGVAVTTIRPVRESGPPVLFIHGLFAAGWMFERWMQYMADGGRRASALDLRGHGASEPVLDRGHTRLVDYVDDVLSVVRAMGPVVAVGHSMGGLIAQRLAEGGVVTAAVLVSPAPPRGVPLISLQLVARQARYLPALLRSREIRVRRGDADAMILNRVPFEERGGIFAHFEPDSGRACRDLMLGAVAIDPRRVRCPVLVLAGDEDHFIPLRVAQRVAAKYDAPLRVLPERGHLMMQEQGWEEVAAVIAKWLVSVSA